MFLVCAHLDIVYLLLWNDVCVVNKRKIEGGCMYSVQ